MTQRVARRLVVAAEEVYVEDIFPGPSTHGTGLNLAQADIAQRKHTQGFEKRSRQVLNFERDGSLVGAARNKPLGVTRAANLPNQEKSREVARVVLHAG